MAAVSSRWGAADPLGSFGSLSPMAAALPSAPDTTFAPSSFPMPSIPTNPAYCAAAASWGAIDDPYRHQQASQPQHTLVHRLKPRPAHAHHQQLAAVSSVWDGLPQAVPSGSSSTTSEGADAASTASASPHGPLSPVGSPLLPAAAPWSSSGRQQDTVRATGNLTGSSAAAAAPWRVSRFAPPPPSAPGAPLSDTFMPMPMLDAPVSIMANGYGYPPEGCNVASAAAYGRAGRGGPAVSRNSRGRAAACKKVTAARGSHSSGCQHHHHHHYYSAPPPMVGVPAAGRGRGRIAHAHAHTATTPPPVYIPAASFSSSFADHSQRTPGRPPASTMHNRAVYAPALSVAAKPFVPFTASRSTAPKTAATPVRRHGEEEHDESPGEEEDDGEDVADGHELLQSYLYHKYLRFRDRALEERQVRGAGRSPLVTSLYRFWLERLQHKFNRQMYQTFKDTAMEDAEMGRSREGMEILYRFLRRSLLALYRERLFRDFIYLVGIELHEDTYGLEQLWLFLRERSEDVRVRSELTVRRRIFSRPDMSAALRDLDRFHAYSFE